MRRLLAITAFTVAGFATASDAGQVNPAVFTAGSVPVTAGLTVTAGETDAALHQANFKIKKIKRKRFHSKGFRTRGFKHFGHSKFKTFGHVRGRGFHGHGLRTRGFIKF